MAVAPASFAGNFGIGAHALAAALFALVAAWQASRWRDPAARTLIAASLATAGWGWASVAFGPHAILPQVAEGVRNLGWLGFVLVLGRHTSRHPALSALYGALAFAALGATAADIAALGAARQAHADLSLLLATWSLHMIFAVGALVALHHLFTAAAADARRAVAPPLAGLALLWLYDLTFYATSWAQRAVADETATVRGVVVLLAAGAIAYGVRRNVRLEIRLSRSAAFQTIGLVAALAYLFAVMVAAAALDSTMGSAAQGVQSIALLVAAIVVGLGMTSARVRAWTRVMLAKHLFAHRYDYRGEWLRFTGTLGAPGVDAAPLDMRVVKAVADIVEAPGGLLLTHEGGALQAGQRWSWATLQPGSGLGGSDLVAFLASGRVIELDALRRDRRLTGEAAAVPEWMTADRDAWAIAPLIHRDALIGAVLLERPLVPRALDWEDFDLLRLAGRQVASYLAEARAQEALTDAQAFDEFNRRFAFIMHDIKNLASQLALVTRNAERHADKPAFRADMVATLQDATGRLTDLLARLSQQGAPPPATRDDGALTIDLYAVAASVAASQRARHPIVVTGQATSVASGHPARLSKALAHLVANAIDASASADPVTLTLVKAGGEVGIAVGDHGAGMSAEFVRASLFRPFASTKADGFGIGAFEACAIVAALGGRIAVDTEIGRGSTLTIWLPAATSAVVAGTTEKQAA